MLLSSTVPKKWKENTLLNSSKILEFIEATNS